MKSGQLYLSFTLHEVLSEISQLFSLIQHLVLHTLFLNVKLDRLYLQQEVNVCENFLLLFAVRQFSQNAHMLNQ